MPVKKRLQKTRPANASELTRLLIEEWQRPRESGQPLIVIEGDDAQPRHIYVIWDEWRDLNQTDRSEIIMDVVENLTGPHAINDLSLVTVAMGLTAEEANRMGINAA